MRPCPALAALLLCACPQGTLLPVDRDTGLVCAEGQAHTWFTDGDGDGFGDPASAAWACAQPPGTIANGTDCDDTRATVYPDAPEICDGEDNDCDGWIDDEDRDRVGGSTWCADSDGDGDGDPAVTVVRCQGQGQFVERCADCDDDDPAIHPGAGEFCNGVDDDCDGLVDGQDEDLQDGITWYADTDRDGYGDPDDATLRCSQPAGAIDDSSDCDDGDASINPAATEVCDGVDDDCDGLVDDDDPDMTGGSTWCRDADGDGYGDPDVTVRRCTQPTGYVANCRDPDDGDPSVGGTSDRDDGTICASLMGSDDGLVPTWTGDCDTSLGFSSYGGHCYFSVSVHTTWPDARASCLAAGGYLSTATDASENTFIQSLNSRPYLGACDADVEDTWTWITGEAWSYTNWGGSEPNDTSPGEDCLEFSGTSDRWNDIWCDRYSYGAGYICEFEGTGEPGDSAAP